jgi:MFS family permease
MARAADTTTPTARPAGAASRARRVVRACLAGTALEWYDFFLYNTAAALVFGALFFPQADPAVGTLLAFATYGVGFVARPVGALIFGHFGDRVGRRNVLAATLLIMGMATFLIGLLPAYAAMGTLAPALLVSLRFVQGLSLGGQWGGAVLMTMEHGAPARRGLTTAWVQVGVPAGTLLASGMLGLAHWALPEDDFLTWGWRLPFLLSGVLALMGLWIRRNLPESPEFEALRREGRISTRPLAEVLRRRRRALASAFCARIGVDVAFYTFTLYLLTYLAEQAAAPGAWGINAVLLGSAVQLVLIPVFGAASDRLGRRQVCLAGAVVAAVWGFVFFPLLDSGSFAAVALAVGVGLAAHAAMYGPQAAFIAELFPARTRYSGTSLGYQLAGVPGGALAPVIAIVLFDAFASGTAIALYVLAALGVTALGLAIAPREPTR